jgi:hypothetical protein
MIIAAILLGLASLGGVAILSIRLRGANPPLGLAMAHGVLAGAGLVTLAVFAFSTRANGAPLVAIVAYVLAAGIGFWMARLHTKGHLIPIAGVFIHVLMVIFGWAALLAHFFG